MLVLGATGMLGHTVFRSFSADPNLEVWGTLRDPGTLKYFSESQRARLLPGIDVLDDEALATAIRRVKPNVLVNCVGVINQLATAKDPLVIVPINAMLPHRLARLCGEAGGRLIHVSTDCVFSGCTSQTSPQVSPIHPALAWNWPANRGMSKVRRTRS